MIKIYQNYLIKLFLRKIILISVIFLSLIFILSIFEEISYFKDIDVGIYFPFLLTILNTPSTLFEIFPFIFLISSQFFFLELIDKNELEFLKVHGLNNIKIIKILSSTSIILGIFLILIFYQISSQLKFLYFDLKNDYSKDDKYLAVVTENGLWIKDELDEKKYVINASKINGKYLENVSITEFDLNYKLIQIIESEKVDVSNKKWNIFKPTISINNSSKILQNDITVFTHFDLKKINSMFRNLTSLNLLELRKMKQDYEDLGYSTSEITSHLNQLYSFPIYLSIMSVFSAIIMLNIKRNKPMIYHIISGVLFSVIIYYFYYLFSLLGENGKIPLTASTWLPLLLLMIFILIGLVRINEK